MMIMKMRKDRRDKRKIRKEKIKRKKGQTMGDGWLTERISTG
jgi:hypothetical protein